MTLSEVYVLGMFGTFAGLLMAGFPVAWVLGGSAVIWTLIGLISVDHFDASLWFDWGSSLGLMSERLWGLVGSETLLALPMFIFMGIMLDHTGIAERLMRNMVRIFGAVRGGYAVTVVIIGVLLAASTGVIGASVVLLGSLAIPNMMAARYDKSLAVGVTCASGTLGILIPPSIMLVLMADRLASPEASVGALFMGALFPGLILGAAYVIFIFVMAALRPNWAPVPDSENASEVNFTVVWEIAKAVFPAMLLILAVLGSIFSGIATPTEASGVGAAGAVLLALANGKLTREVMKSTLRQTTVTTSFIFAIFIGATAFSVVLRGLGGDEVISEAILGLPVGPHMTVVVILGVVFLLGFFLDWVEISLIILPLVAPVVVQLGFDLVWFTILFAVCLQTSFLTPPVGFALFYVRGVCPPEITTRDVYRGIIPFVILQFLVLVLIFAFPGIATWLPSVSY